MVENKEYPESTLVESRLPCEDCQSSDALSLYSDGHTYCFSCNKYTAPPREQEADNYGFQEQGAADMTDTPTSKKTIPVKDGAGLLPIGDYFDLPSRGLKKRICEKYNVCISKDADDNQVLVFNYSKDGEVVGQKLRWKDKRFAVRGKLPGLFGEHLFQAGGGECLTITEGEIDCLSVFQCFYNSEKATGRPVVSVPNGAAAAVKAIRESYTFVTSFNRILLMFDEDEAGKKAAHEVAKILPPGKVYIANLPLKDANELLVAGREQEIVRAYWDAKEYRPDGIIDASSEEIWNEIVEISDKKGIPYPWAGLNRYTGGIRKKELVTLTSGTGMGKSTLVRELIHHLQTDGHRLGLVMLEESAAHTIRSLMGTEMSLPLNVDPLAAPLAEQREAFEKVTKDLFMYSNFGGMSFNELEETCRYLAVGRQCDFIVLDHLSMAVIGMDDNGSERQVIDQVVTALRKIVDETGVGIVMISHLSRTQGTPHEEGGQISMKSLRGSHAIAQVSDMVIALERNQQDKTRPNLITVRVLKNRYSGATGECGYLLFRPSESRLYCTETYEGFTPEELRMIPEKNDEPGGINGHAISFNAPTETGDDY